jgi:magnesium chelatase family protein
VIDRIDIWVEVGRLGADEIDGAPDGEPSAQVADRVRAAESRRAARDQRVPNGELAAAEVRVRARLTPGAGALARNAVNELALSGRGYDRMLRVARTIADLGGAERVDEEHVAEALGLRKPADR